MCPFEEAAFQCKNPACNSLLESYGGGGKTRQSKTRKRKTNARGKTTAKAESETKTMDARRAAKIRHPKIGNPARRSPRDFLSPVCARALAGGRRRGPAPRRAAAPRPPGGRRRVSAPIRCRRAPRREGGVWRRVAASAPGPAIGVQDPVEATRGGEDLCGRTSPPSARARAQHSSARARACGPQTLLLPAVGCAAAPEHGRPRGGRALHSVWLSLGRRPVSHRFRRLSSADGGPHDQLAQPCGRDSPAPSQKHQEPTVNLSEPILHRVSPAAGIPLVSRWPVNATHQMNGNLA